MKKILLINLILCFSFLFSQSMERIGKDTISIHYLKGSKLYNCILIRTENVSIENKGKCINEREILPEDEKYQSYKNKLLYPKRVDRNYQYDLPYKKGESYKVLQGYDGDFSHQNKYALDFDMPIGTPILAIRDGVVIKVVQEFNRGCASKKCAKYNNYVLIFHEDDTMASYSHLKQNGVKVKVGDLVKKGEVIGFSGNTGYSTAPHLHLECTFYNEFRKEKETIKTLFRTGDGNRIEYLYEGEAYRRDY